MNKFIRAAMDQLAANSQAEQRCEQAFRSAAWNAMRHEGKRRKKTQHK